MKLNVNTKTQTRIYNVPIYGVKGEFTLSADIAVPYFSALIDIQRLASEIKTHEQVAASLDQTYNLQELYQREIDTDRIDRDMVKHYLMDPNKIKFFNSLTVALLPKDEDGKIVGEFQEFEDNDPQIPENPENKFDENFRDHPRVIFGGVQFVATESAGISRLRWDSTRVDAVAVDGQHRLTALMRWFEDKKNKSLNPTEQRTVIPVIFLLLSEKAGFKRGTHHQSKGIKAIAREIFTDLNKNAKTVDKATEIILDDRSLTSRCVRKLVSEETCQDTPGTLPLSLVRWRDANNRFDVDYYINSLVHLNLVVEAILDLPTPKSGMDKKDVLKFINDAGRKLGHLTGGKLLTEGGKDLETYYTENYLDPENGEVVAPMTGIPSQFMPSAVEGFEKRYAPWMVRLMTGPRPYAALLHYARSNNLIEGLFSQYSSQPKSHKKSLDTQLEAKFGAEWRDHQINAHQDAIRRIKGCFKGSPGEEWLYKAIFQKAVLRLGRVVCVDTPVDEQERVGTVDDLVAFLDVLHERGLLVTTAKLRDEPKELWTLISLNPVNPTIQVTAASEERIFSLLRLLYFGDRYLKWERNSASGHNGQLAPSQECDSLVKKLCQKQVIQEWPLEECCRNILEAFEKNAHVFLGRESAEDVSQDEKTKLARRRLSRIFEVALFPQETGPMAAADSI